jgi:hypothetical protein
MTTNINVNLLTVTPQRNVNTLVQGSTIASSNGPLSEVLNNQAIRTVKGCVAFPATGGTGTAVVINNYDGSPVSFASGDIIVAMALSNASSAYAASAPSNFPNSFTGVSGTGVTDVRFYTAEKPTLNAATQLWAPGTTRDAITPVVDLGALYPNPGLPPTYMTNPPVSLNVSLSGSGGIGTQANTYPNAVWMNAAYTDIPSLPGISYGVNITMLVINPHLAQ